MLFFACSNPNFIALCRWFCPRKPPSTRNTKPRGQIPHRSVLPKQPRWQVTPKTPFPKPPGAGREGRWVGGPSSLGTSLTPNAGHRCLPPPTAWCPRPCQQPRHAREAKPSAPQEFLSIPSCRKHAESNRWEEEGGGWERGFERSRGNGEGHKASPWERHRHLQVFMDIHQQKGGLGAPPAQRSPPRTAARTLEGVGRAPGRWCSPPPRQAAKLGKPWHRLPPDKLQFGFLLQKCEKESLFLKLVVGKQRCLETSPLVLQNLSFCTENE